MFTATNFNGGTSGKSNKNFFDKAKDWISGKVNGALSHIDKTFTGLTPETDPLANLYPNSSQKPSYANNGPGNGGFSSASTALKNYAPVSPSASLGAANSYSPSSPTIPAPSSPSAASSAYLNADLAKAYGMSNDVAYQEALSNTAYQRAMKDMQAAGLNPAVMFSSGRASAAQGITYIPQDYDTYAGTAYTSARGYGTASSKYGNIPNGLYNVIKLAGGGLGAILNKRNPISGFWVGSSIAESGLKAISGFLGRFK
nr:pilot protein for DNA ejection [Microvirus sp.]